MTDPDHFAGIDATWPAAEMLEIGKWTFRRGNGGGKRVSAATAREHVTTDDIRFAEAKMAEMGQDPLFQIRTPDDGLDAQLAQLGYTRIDPVVIMAGPVAQVAETPPAPISAFVLPKPMAIMKELWAEAGVGPERLAVMERASQPHTAILGRVKDRASGVAFAAIHEKTVFCHALEVSEHLRRQGTAINMLRAIAKWAQDYGAETFATLVVENNSAARALFASLNFQDVGHYHYRIKAPAEDRA